MFWFPLYSKQTVMGYVTALEVATSGWERTPLGA